ncbi:MAG: histidine phosphatase family protein [Chrysiogenetes bacterium]|nr:histidine phosphatase family protein [Chrysiogenetes bacterium]
MQLLLVRHGETDWNLEQRFQGVSDVPLCERGRAQAASLRAHLGDEGFDAVFASPLQRALETAEILSGLSREEIEVIPEIQEMNQGKLEGLTWKELLAEHPEIITRWMSEPVDLRIPGGETIREVASRMAAGLRSVRERAHGRRVLVVSHNLAISAGLAELLGEGPEHFRRYRQEPCAINRIEWHEEPLSLHVCNDYSFLPPEQHPVKYGPHAE